MFQIRKGVLKCFVIGRNPTTVKEKQPESEKLIRGTYRVALGKTLPLVLNSCCNCFQVVVVVVCLDRQLFKPAARTTFSVSLFGSNFSNIPLR